MLQETHFKKFGYFTIKTGKITETIFHPGSSKLRGGAILCSDPMRFNYEKIGMTRFTIFFKKENWKDRYLLLGLYMLQIQLSIPI